MLSLRCVGICKADTSKALEVRKLVITVPAPSGALIPAVWLTKSVVKPFKLTVLHSLFRWRNNTNQAAVSLLAWFCLTSVCLEKLNQLSAIAVDFRRLKFILETLGLSGRLEKLSII